MDVAELVEQARNGDVDAFTALVRRYEAMVHGYAYATVRDLHLADDIAQQSFLTAWRNLSQLQDPARFGGWLRGIVRFESLHSLRARRVNQVPLDDAVGLVSRERGPEGTAEARESLELVIRAIDTLPESERMVAALFYLHDRAQREIASFLAVPVTTVNNRLRSARKHLREGGLFAMSHTPNLHRPAADAAADFAERVGAVIRASGPIVDSRFATTERPRVLSTVTISDDASGRTWTAQVSQYLDDDVVRSIVLGDPGSIPAGTMVRDAGSPASAPLDPATIAGMLERVRPGTATDEIIATGIKVVDLCAPIPVNGVIALVGDMQTGKMVFVEELIHRMQETGQRLAIVVFVQIEEEAQRLRNLEYRTSETVQAIYLPVADASVAVLGELTKRFDAVFDFSRELGKETIYPAIEPVTSWSRLLETGSRDPDHLATASAAKDVLANSDPEERRRQLLRRYMGQTFYVAEPYTRRPGTTVPLATTIADARSILDGKWDDLDPGAIAMIGSLDDVTGA